MDKKVAHQQDLQFDIGIGGGCYKPDLHGFLDNPHGDVVPLPGLSDQVLALLD